MDNPHSHVGECRFSPFLHVLPEDFSDLQEFHESIRSGVFGIVTRKDVKQAYLNSLLGEEDNNTLSQAITLFTTEKRVSVNKVLEYIELEFSNYYEHMNNGFKKFSGLSEYFSDDALNKKVCEWLRGDGLIEINFFVINDGEEEIISIEECGELTLPERYVCFWEVVKHIHDGNIKISNISFTF